MNVSVGQASRVSSERASGSRKSNLSSASPTGAGETPALVYRLLGPTAQRATTICRETLSVKLPSESGSKLHALQTLSRSCCDLPLREAFGVRTACRRFGFRSPRREFLRGILSRPLALAAALTLFTHTTFAQTWQTVDDFQYVAGKPAENFGLALAPTGVLFASGFGFDASGTSHGLVMASADAGKRLCRRAIQYLDHPQRRRRD